LAAAWGAALGSDGERTLALGTVGGWGWLFSGRRASLDKIDTSNDTQQTLERGVQHKNEPGGRERGLEPGPSNACLPSY